MSDAVHMRRALALAERGWGQTAPNPMVGAVVVAGGEVVGEGWHARFAEDHAEVAALRAAGERARGATMYVTLEPCTHVGKTPPCVGAVIAAGIARVVIAVRDPSPVARGGAEQLRAAGIDVDIGSERAAACELNAAFFNAHASGRPWVTLKLAISADGGIARTTGPQQWISGVESRAEVHRLRAGVDAIAVGVGTVLADDPALTVRDAPAPRRPPRRVIFDNSLKTPMTSAVVRSARDVPTTIFTVEPALATPERARLADAGVEVAAARGVADALRVLRAEDVRSVLLEGGARLAGSFLRESLVDRLIIFRSPHALGGDMIPAFAFAPAGFEAGLAHVPIVAERAFGEDRMTTYALQDVPCSPD